MARPNKVVILITGDPVEDVRAESGDYGAIIERALGDAWSGPYLAVDARDQALPRLDERDAVVISGSSANVHERAPWMKRSEAWLRELVGGGTPVLGLCFGHQLLAQALHGEVAPNPRGREIGTVTVERIMDDPLFDGLEDAFTANSCHVDTVSRLPPDATVLARSAGDDHQALRFAPRCYGVQFHPEFDGPLIKKFIRARSEAMVEEGLDPEATHRAATDTPLAQAVLANFIRLISS